MIEVWCGVRPFGEEQTRFASQLMENIASGKLRPSFEAAFRRVAAVRKVNRSIPMPRQPPAALASLVQECLSKNPSERPAFVEIAQRLNRVLRILIKN